ncbi:MAG: ribosome assembly RNA-binding protein YhbY [Treponemataceae bacterium]|nr:ribosome assembly RNA-binding protein YhbY [Treponemataceae bacterium]
MIELTSKQRKFFEKEAHSLSPVVIVGAAGVSEGVIKMVDETLGIHELIKVKFNEFKEDKRKLSEVIAEETNCVLVRLIGNVAIFYRPAEEEDKRRYPDIA